MVGKQKNSARDASMCDSLVTVAKIEQLSFSGVEVAVEKIEQHYFSGVHKRNMVTRKVPDTNAIEEKLHWCGCSVLILDSDSGTCVSKPYNFIDDAYVNRHRRY